MKNNFLRIFVIILFFLTGCSTKARLCYTPVYPIQPANDIAVTLGQFEDLRAYPENVGAKRNLYGIPIITIKTDDSIPEWVVDALRRELENAGYRTTEIVQPSAYVIEGKIVKTEANTHLIYFGNVIIELCLKKDGTIIFDRRYQSNQDGGANWVGSTAHCMITLEKNLQIICDLFIQDLNQHIKSLSDASISQDSQELPFKK